LGRNPAGCIGLLWPRDSFLPGVVALSHQGAADRAAVRRAGCAAALFAASDAPLAADRFASPMAGSGPPILSITRTAQSPITSRLGHSRTARTEA
jgi:hypothetical protein